MKKPKVLLVLLILVSTLIFVILFLNERADRLTFVGVYKIDINASDFGNHYPDSNKFVDLELRVNNDYTFVFSKKAPFLHGRRGTWKIITADAIPYCNISYPDGVGSQIEKIHFGILMRYPSPDDGTQVQLLVFNKVTIPSSIPDIVGYKK